MYTAAMAASIRPRIVRWSRNVVEPYGGPQDFGPFPR